MVSRPRRCSARIVTKSASCEKDAPNVLPSPAFHAVSRFATIASTAARSDGLIESVTSFLPSCLTEDCNAPLEYSVRSPRVVDHEAPGAVCLTTQNICVVSRQHHRQRRGPDRLPQGLLSL